MKTGTKWHTYDDGEQETRWTGKPQPPSQPSEPEQPEPEQPEPEQPEPEQPEQHP